MLKFSNLDKFKNDLAKFKSAIDIIPNAKYKKNAENLLKRYVDCAKLIDDAHDPSNNGYINPRATRDNIEEIIMIRRQLEQVIKDLNCA